MSHVIKAATVLGLALVAWALFVLVGRSSALESAKRTIAEQKEANAAVVEFVYREKRALVERNKRDIETMQKAMRVANRQANAALIRGGTTIDSLRSLLENDSTQSGNVAVASLSHYDSLAGAFRDYLRSDSTYHNAMDAERLSVFSLLTLADSTIAAKNEAIKALRNVGECRIIGPIRCPTRTQAFVGGTLLTLGVLMAVR